MVDEEEYLDMKNRVVCLEADLETLNNKYILEKIAKEELGEILENCISKETIIRKIEFYRRGLADCNDSKLKHELRVRIKELEELLGVDYNV